MIAVIADDFTGAAEIGGIALKYGLKIIIETRVKEVSDAEVLIIATDTRSLSADEASSQIKKITKKLKKLNPQFIFKKLDSVLRGNIASELVTQMVVSEIKRTIIVAGNPAFGRLIRNGMYTIHSIPLSETHFANAPDFPIQSSSVVEIIKNDECKVVSKNVDGILPEEGLIIGDVNDFSDMQKWAGKINQSTIAAGGAGFFDVILNSMFIKIQQPQNGIVKQGDYSLYVFGSTFPKNSEMLNRFKGNSIRKIAMPDEIYGSNDFSPVLFDAWVEEVVDSLLQQQRVIISADQDYNKEEGLASRIKKIVAELVRRVMQEVELTDLFIEGGATASEILQSLKITKLYPFRELAQGTIQMKVNKFPQLTITTKPGSYSWPENISFEKIESQIEVG